MPEIQARILRRSRVTATPGAPDTPTGMLRGDGRCRTVPSYVAQTRPGRQEGGSNSTKGQDRSSDPRHQWFLETIEVSKDAGDPTADAHAYPPRRRWSEYTTVDGKADFLKRLCFPPPCRRQAPGILMHATEDTRYLTNPAPRSPQNRY